MWKYSEYHIKANKRLKILRIIIKMCVTWAAAEMGNQNLNINLYGKAGPTGLVTSGNFLTVQYGPPAHKLMYLSATSLNI
jgi:hypothetical protein